MRWMSRETFYCVILMAWLSFHLTACKKDENTQRFEGTVKRGNLGQSLSGAQVIAQTQEINNGVFSSDYSSIGSMSTAADGRYTIPFETATYPSLRLQFSKSGYHTRFVDVDPQFFADQNTFTKNIFLFPKSTIQVHVSDQLPAYSQLWMRYKNTDFECTCCDDSWKYFTQPNIDTTFSCMVYGDQFVHYQYRWIGSGIDTLIDDSIYCTAFETANIDLSY